MSKKIRQTNPHKKQEQWVGKVRPRYRYQLVLFGLRVIKNGIRGYGFGGFEQHDWLSGEVNHEVVTDE